MIVRDGFAERKELTYVFSGFSKVYYPAARDEDA